MTFGRNPEDRIRRMADGIPPLEADLDSVKARGTWRKRRGLTTAAAGSVAGLLLLAGAGVFVLRGDEAPDAVGPTTSTAAPTTTVPPVATTTTSTMPATTIAVLPTTTVPTAPRPDPDAIVLAESAGEVGVQLTGNGPFTLNPFLESADAWRITGQLGAVIQRGAWRPGANGDPVADLVEMLPSPRAGTAVIQPDGTLVLTYRIRPDAVWSDGTPVSAEDFRLTLDILQDPDQPLRTDWRQAHGGIVDFSSAGPSEFTVTLAAADGRYRQLFPVVVPAHAVDPATFADDWTERAWPSAGPFVLTEFHRFQLPRAAQMVLARNPEYPAEAGAPTTIIIDFHQRDGSGDSLAVEAFRNRQADALGPSAAWEFLRDNIEPVGEVSTGAFIWEVLFLQSGDQRLGTNPESRLDEVAVRRAVLQAIDPKALATVGDPIGSLVEFFVGVPNPGGGWESIRFDLAAVADTLGGPLPIVYTTTSGMLTMDIGTEVVEQLVAAGFDVTADFVGDSSAAFDAFNRGDFEAFAIRLVRTPGTQGLADLFEVFRADAPPAGEFPGFPNVWGDNTVAASEFSRILDEFAVELDPDRRIQLLIEAEDVLVDQMLIIPLVERNGDNWVFHQDRITGPEAADLHHAWLMNLDEWRRVDG